MVWFGLVDPRSLLHLQFMISLSFQALGYQNIQYKMNKEEKLQKYLRYSYQAFLRLKIKVKLTIFVKNCEHQIERSEREREDENDITELVSRDGCWHGHYTMFDFVA